MKLSGSRIQNWDVVMYRFIEDKRHQPFQWSQNDCLIFVSELEALISHSPKLSWVMHFMGKYSNEEQGLKLMAKNDTWQIMEENFEATTRPRRGDIIGVDHNQNKCLGVWIGGQGAMLGLKGLKSVPSKLTDRSWTL